MITNGLVSWMNQVPGPGWKTYPGKSTCEFYVPHSAVAQIFTYLGVLDPDRNASWCVTFYQTRGRMPDQHYPYWAKTWTSGNSNINSRAIACEYEGGTKNGPGGYSQPWTDWQVECTLRFLEDLKQETGRTYQRITPIPRYRPMDTLAPDLGLIVEHNEVSQWLPEGDATACPSGRNLRLYEALLEDDMSEEDKKLLRLLADIVCGNGLQTEVWSGPTSNRPHLIAAGVDLTGVVDGQTILITGPSALEYAKLRQFSFALGLKLNVDKTNKVEHDLEVLKNTPVPSGPVAPINLSGYSKVGHTHQTGPSQNG